MPPKSAAQRSAEYVARQKAIDKEAYYAKRAANRRKSREKKKKEIEELRRQAAQPIALMAQQAFESAQQERKEEAKAILKASEKTAKQAFKLIQKTAKEAFKSNEKSNEKMLKSNEKALKSIEKSSGKAFKSNEKSSGKALETNVKTQKTSQQTVSKVTKAIASSQNALVKTSSKERQQSLKQLLKKLGCPLEKSGQEQTPTPRRTESPIPDTKQPALDTRDDAMVDDDLPPDGDNFSRLVDNGSNVGFDGMNSPQRALGEMSPTPDKRDEDNHSPQFDCDDELSFDSRGNEQTPNSDNEKKMSRDEPPALEGRGGLDGACRVREGSRPFAGGRSNFQSRLFGCDHTATQPKQPVYDRSPVPRGLRPPDGQNSLQRPSNARYPNDSSVVLRTPDSHHRRRDYGYRRGSDHRIVLQSPRSEGRKQQILKRQQSRHGRVCGPNMFWRPGSRMNIPLTRERRVISFNMDEDMVVTSIALRLCHEAIRENVPVFEGDGLGAVLTQVQDDLPEEIMHALVDIWDGRRYLQHNEDRKYKFSTREELIDYKRTMHWVLRELAPFWELRHENIAAMEAETRANQLAEHAKQETERAKQETEHAKQEAERAERAERQGDELKSFFEYLRSQIGTQRTPRNSKRRREFDADDGARDYEFRAVKRSRIKEKLD